MTPEIFTVLARELTVPPEPETCPTCHKSTGNTPSLTQCQNIPTVRTVGPICARFRRSA